jgi:hypothetical protein
VPGIERVVEMPQAHSMGGMTKMHAVAMFGIFRHLLQMIYPDFVP